jgi:transposase-like protein
MDHFSAPQFHDDEAARKYLEATLWPEGPVCPHCGVVGHAYATKRPGVFRCAESVCRKDFTVTMRTVMERSKIALHKWLQAFHLMCSSKKGVSAHQLHRTLDIGYEAAWFMAHRIREAMRDGGLAPLGGNGGIVEADETYFGKQEGPSRLKKPRAVPYTKKGHFKNNRAVVSLVERAMSVIADKRAFARSVLDFCSVPTELFFFRSYERGNPVAQTEPV